MVILKKEKRRFVGQFQIKIFILPGVMKSFPSFFFKKLNVTTVEFVFSCYRERVWTPRVAGFS